MEVKIELQKRSVVLFGNISVNDYFEHGGCFYMKMKNSYVINMLTGDVTANMHGQDPVRRISKIVFTVEDY